MDLYWVHIALGTCFIYCFWRIINIYLSPLCHIPGPLFGKITDKWLLLVDLAGHRTTTLHNLHKKYGAVVRIGPNELTFTHVDALRDIYGPSSNYIKGPVYDLFGRRGVFQMQNREEHRQRQKRIAHVFVPASLDAMEPLIHIQVRKLLAALEKRLQKPTDMLYLFRMLALDIVGELFLGNSFGALDSENAPDFVHDLDAAYLAWGIQAQFPQVYNLLCFLPEKRLQHFLSAGDRIYDYGADAFQNYLNNYGRSSNRKDLLTKLMDGESAGDSVSLTDTEISIEITNLVFAATDTTGNTFTYLFWELAKYPEWQSRLREELEHVHFVSGVPSYKDVAQLQILDAVVQEVLRMHPAAPASLQRIDSISGGVIAGIVVPPNTTVSSQSYTTQRDPFVFPSPDLFSPDRWISTQGGTDAMRELMLVWGKGNRACLGRTMATMELKIATAAIMRRYSVRLASQKTNDDMRMTDHFTLIPKGKQCFLIFENAASE